MHVFAFHAPTQPFIEKTARGYKLFLYIPKPLKLESIWIRGEPENEETLYPMEIHTDNGRWRIWQGDLTLNSASNINLYVFKLMQNGQQYWLDATGHIKHYFPERTLHFRINPTYKPASWVWSQVFYQIFPERFFDGDPSNNVKSNEYLYNGEPVIAKSWGELPERSQGQREFYGGDLEGIRQKLPYLEDLGISALYLNPIFESPSSHKYDTCNFERVDPHFGSNETLAQLCQDLKDRKMRIILDAVINHTSEQHPWFNRYGEFKTPGAYQSKEAKTREFYVFGSTDPESYHGWYGVKTLPVLDYSSKELRKYMYEGQDAFLRRWLRPPYSIDGWRFDVIHMLGEGKGAKNNAYYVQQFRQTLREENPEAYVLGEHFYEASQWLQGDQEDAAMNYYGFTLPVWGFLAHTDHRGHGVHIDAEDLDHALVRARASLPFEMQLSQFNLLNSHDTARFISLVKGDKALVYIATTLLFTYIGVPCVYYGDEIGLEGGHDPDCRRTFPWEGEWDHSLHRHYKRLIQFRQQHEVLQRGSILTLYASKDIYAFARILDQDCVITLINRGKDADIDLPVWKLGLQNSSLKDLFTAKTFMSKEGILSIRIGEKQARLLY